MELDVEIVEQGHAGKDVEEEFLEPSQVEMEKLTQVEKVKFA